MIIKFGIENNFKIKKEEPKKSLSFRIPRELDDEVERMAEECGVSKHRYLAALIESFLDSES